MSTWIVRISPNNRVATQDWNTLLTEARVHPHVSWDKDYKNRIRVGDTIGFIVGEVSNPRIHFYNIIGELSTKNRSNTWSPNSYTSSQIIEHDINTREVIVLDTNTHIEYDFNVYKSRVGYKEKYIPRGTTKARPFF